MVLLWHLMALRSRDMTPQTRTKSCLVLAPHPDDETLGCGGIILHKRAAGAEVTVAVVTDGAASHLDDPAHATSRAKLVEMREAETHLAVADLGVAAEHLHFLGFPDGHLGEHHQALCARLHALIAQTQPDEIYVCALQDGHRDHIALARALRTLADEGALKGIAHWEYPVWTWDFRSWRPGGKSNKAGFVLGVWAMLRFWLRTPVYSVSLHGLQAIKRQALERHRSQIGLLEEEPDWPGLPESFLAHFFRSRELFIAVHSDGSRQ